MGFARCTAIAGAVCLATGLETRGDVFTNVPEASGYQLVYSLNIPNVANFDSTGVPYSVNNSSSFTNTGFDRVAYYLELQPTGGGPSQYVYASMKAFTNDVTKIGVPVSGSFQRNVLDMHVFASSGSGVTAGTYATGGNIEFWPHGYDQANVAGVPGASNSTYDRGDTVEHGISYGSMQIHNHAVNQTLLAYNQWQGYFTNGNGDLGIGNSGTGEPDWTFRDNANQYSVKSLQVLARPGTAPRTLKIMTLGDSITYGYKINGGYQVQLFKNLVNDGFLVDFQGKVSKATPTILLGNDEIQQQGHSGYTTQDILNNLNGSDNSNPDASNAGGFWLAPNNGIDPDFILLNIGTNDFGKDRDQQNAINRLDQILDAIAQLRPNAHVVLSNLMPRTDDPTANNEINQWFNPFVDDLVLEHQQQGHKVSFLDLASLINPAVDFYDGLHPTEAGAAKIGDAFYGAILQQVPEPGSLGTVLVGAVLFLSRRRRLG